MRILAIDTALGACAAAVYDSETSSLLAEESLPMVRGHAEALMPLIARVMDAASVEFHGLDRIAVTIGPGSFTGLRVGISAARGIALAAGRPAVGVSTLAAYAAPHIVSGAAAVAVAIDARNDHVYFQLVGTGGKSLVPPSHLSIVDATKLDAVRLLEGPAHIVGSAAEALASAWPSDIASPSMTDMRAAPDITWVAKLGIAAQAGLAPPKPAYLRPPGAKPQNVSGLARQALAAQ